MAAPREKPSLRVFEGFSTGSNGLTQLVSGIDRDSRTIANLVDERNDGFCECIGRTIEAAHRVGKPIEICGQAPSGYSEFAEWGLSSAALHRFH